MIKAQDLTMYYGSVKAVTNATFEVSKGEVVGLLGPNGAGKSTIMKILTTYLIPTSGTATVGGHSILEEPMAVRRLIGYLPEVLPLYMNMEVVEYLTFVGKARQLSGDRLNQRLEWVKEKCGLAPMWRKLVQELSKGYRQRTALAQALIHDPEVVILDEPTSGLDPHQILEIRNLVRELARSKTVILSTHILQEAEAMADRIIIINRGRIVAQGTLTQLRVKAQESGRVRFAVRASRVDVENSLAEISAIHKRRCEGEESGVCRFVVEGPDDRAIVAHLGMLAVKKSWQVLELTAAPYNLEETFLSLTESDRKGDAA